MTIDVSVALLPIIAWVLNFLSLTLFPLTFPQSPPHIFGLAD
ncbi:hypothetical protein FDUTEX481_03516 [Tolypothrix sp. PCC 7601]|nr:hypothetical protein FDUTEX481_03516 [Tolypothrix sp. PCC 7601]